MPSSLQPNLVALATVAGPVLVGLTFIWAGIIKAISPHVFREHLSQLGLVPHKFRFTSVVVAAGLEVGWGMTLLLGVAPPLTLPVTAVLLAGLTAVSVWGVRSGRTTATTSGKHRTTSRWRPPPEATGQGGSRWTPS